MKPISPSKKRHRRRGTVLLEFMFVLPIFLFLTLFAVDMGRMILVAGAMNDAAYVSARAGAQRGGAGDPTSGPARSAYDRALAAIPGTASEDSQFAVIQGSCNTSSSYIVIEVSQRTHFITPGLGSLLAIIGDGSATSDTQSGFMLRSRGAVLCEVIR